MHSAPAVAYPVRRSRAGGLYLLAMGGLSVTVSALWLVQARSGWFVGIGVLCCMLTCFWCAQAWRAMPVGKLVWDGAAWQFLSAKGAPQVSSGLSCRQLVVTLDLQRHLLLRWPGRGAAKWFWIDRASRPLRWHALRRAVYSPTRYAEGSHEPGAAAAAP